MIITGAPVENLSFEEVDYWPELCDIFDWAHKNVFFRPKHLLGRPGCALLSLRHSEIPAREKNVRRLSTPRTRL